MDLQALFRKRIVDNVCGMGRGRARVILCARLLCDKDHMKNCLGLTKGHDNIYSSLSLTVELKSSYRHAKEIATALLKAKFDNDITITLKMIPF